MTQIGYRLKLPAITQMCGSHRERTG